MIAIVAAIREEVAGIKSLERQSSGQAKVLVTGPGKACAVAATEELVRKHPKPQAIISTGFCAGLLDELNTGDLVLPRRLNLANAQNPLIVDSRLSQIAEECIHENVLPYMRRDSVTVPKLLATTEAKLEAGRSYNAQCASLEDYWVCSVASSAGVPFLSTHVVLDTSSQSIKPHIEHLMWLRQEKGQLKAIFHAISKPMDYPTLLLLAKRARQASNQLAIFLRAFVFKTLKGGTEELA
ncbi:hypothetical protein FIM12_01510 [SAR202 cluster bacterium AD-804-J14_MRT_500m]|nr:hypothetical protein [SAR202 cluster bacterium AD-804-J14_MRT_500m]